VALSTTHKNWGKTNVLLISEEIDTNEKWARKIPTFFKLSKTFLNPMKFLLSCQSKFKSQG
jgi:hypothetical protein